MGLDQGQGELSHFANQEFEAAMFLDPFLDLGDEVNRNVGGLGFGFDLPGQIVAEVFVAFGAAAVGVAASASKGDQAGGQDGPLGLELLLAREEEAT